MVKSGSVTAVRTSSYQFVANVYFVALYSLLSMNAFMADFAVITA